MHKCIGICACLSGDPILAENQHQRQYTVWTLTAGDIMVNLSTESCALAHELPVSVDWQNRTGRDLARVLLTTYLAPPVILLTALTNITICVVLTRKHMVSPTNVILLSMALVDMLTGLCPLPMYLISEFAHEWTLARVCGSPLAVNLVMISCNTLPTIFHTASIWLTVILAIQRWIYINFPVSVRRLCTIRASVKATLALLCTVTAFMCTWFYVDGPYKSAMPSPPGGQPIVVSCTEEGEESVFKAMVYVRTLLANVVPSVLLIAFTALLIKGIGQAARRRKSLSSRGGTTGSSRRKAAALTRQASTMRRTDETGNTTVMLTLVVGMFMVVELPMTVVMGLYLLRMEGRLVSDIDQVMGYAMPVINFAILVTYPLNFFIYSMMSTQFRDTFAGIFCRLCSCCCCHQQEATGDEDIALQQEASTAGVRVVVEHFNNSNGGTKFAADRESTLAQHPLIV